MPATAGAPGSSPGVSGPAHEPNPGMRWRRVFPGQERELSSMRRWLAGLLPDGPERDDVTSVATELGSNAIKHTASGRGGWFAVEVTVYGRPATVRLAVADSGSPEGPAVVDEPLAEHGRGLMLVHGLSLRTGVSGDHRGRVIWADIPMAAAPADPAEPGEDPYEAAVRAGRAELATQYPGVPVWFGRATMQWWALAGPAGISKLVTAPSAQELADVIGTAAEELAAAQAMQASEPGLLQIAGSGPAEYRHGTPVPLQFRPGRGSGPRPGHHTGPHHVPSTSRARHERARENLTRRAS
jgi:anti-sigma regulatory factor (Ser/Thr protein kinase)